MYIYHIPDKNFALKFMRNNKELFENSLLDKDKKELFNKKSKLKKSSYIGINLFNKDQLNGLLKYEVCGYNCATIHLYIQKAYQNKNYTTAVGRALKDFLVKTTKIRKLYALFPVGCRHVKLICERNGFVCEGIMSKFDMWLGQIVDFYIYGLELKRG